jgi:hypothetical protein
VPQVLRGEKLRVLGEMTVTVPWDTQRAINELLGIDPMGVTGGLANAPGYYNQRLHQQMLAQQAHMNAVAQYNQGTIGANTIPPQPPTTWHVIPNVRQAKLAQQGERLVAVLPMSIANKINALDFWDETKDRRARFVLTFNNRRSIEFDNIDEFPTAENIARIALECP